MPKDWRAVRIARADLTDYVVHWTRPHSVQGKVVSAFDTLKLIVACGYLRASYAPKHRATVGGQENTIKGPHPAVCFTEQPLDAFIRSCSALPSRYTPYGVALHKWHLY